MAVAKTKGYGVPARNKFNAARTKDGSCVSLFANEWAWENHMQEKLINVEID